MLRGKEGKGKGNVPGEEYGGVMVVGLAILNGAIKKGLPAKVTFDWRSEGGAGISHMHTWGNSILGRRTSKCKGCGELRLFKNL